MKRNYILDIIRGLALMFVVFFHTAVYNFANIHKLDFSNPPIIVVLISFLMLWGGIFIIYSTLINTIMFVSRSEERNQKQNLKYLFFAGIFYIAIHYLLTIVLGRWSVDFVNNLPNMTLVAGSLREMKLVLPDASKLFEGSSLSIIGFNLMFVSSLIALLYKNQGYRKYPRNYLILGVSGLTVMLLSFVRIYLYPLTELFISRQQYLFAVLFSFLIANPYPIFPYLAYGLFGSMLGLMFYRKQFTLMKKVFIPLGLFFFLYGIVGMSGFEKTISKADFFWYFKTHFELGVFLLLITSMLLVFSSKIKRPQGLMVVPYWFSRVCLTVYLFETLLSEILRKFMFLISSEWNQTINSCLLFGGLNIAVWIIILFCWQRINFLYSVEDLWVRLFARMGKQSTKLDS